VFYSFLAVNVGIISYVRPRPLHSLCFPIHYYALCTRCACRAGNVCLSVRLYALLQSRTARRIWIKFGIDIMLLGTTLKSYCTVSCNLITNVESEQTYEVGSTLVPPTVGLFNDAWL
jgi:hypothetical protein